VLGAHRGGTAATKKYIGCDAHARYSIFVVMDENGRCDPPVRVEHDEWEMRRYLATLPPGSPVALETSGNWYWLVRAMEEAGLDPRLAHALEVKKRMPGRNKTDRLDARGLALLLRNGALPEVWIPPARLLDMRDLMRTRLSVRQQGSMLECRILAALRRYGVRDYTDRADLFAIKSRAKLGVSIARTPTEVRIATGHEWALLDALEEHIDALEVRIRERIATIGWARLLKTLGGHDSGRHDLPGDWRRDPIPGGTPPGQLCRPGSDRACQWGKVLDGPDTAIGQSLPEVGLCGGVQCHCDPPEAVGGATYRATVSTIESQQMPREGGDGRGTSPGGVQLVDSQHQTTLS